MADKSLTAQLSELVSTWRAYEATPDNDYSDGIKDGLASAADELEDMLNALISEG